MAESKSEAGQSLTTFYDFERLPVELKVHIFKLAKLAPHEILKSMLVSKKWKELAVEVLDYK